MTQEIPPSERRYQRTRQSILETAQAILAEQGIDGLSMRALAEKVDYSPAALYKYFANKDEIIDALRKQGQEFSAKIQQSHLRPGMSTAETFSALFASYLEFARIYPAHYELIMNSTEHMPESLDAFLEDPDFKGLIDFVTGMVQSGQVRLPQDFRPLHLAFLMWFVGNGAAMLQNKVMHNCQADFSRVSMQVIDMITRLILPEEETGSNELSTGH
ncbi:transcriptional regulator [Longilinea arvoryzae]|uniref:Transcriptional regulator n=1 Tax=Longilinea arvoryzae TaxID=360412 RepID=A0A0S7BDA9_9CHLR|nr:TetR/AcrR family transcriptional regulator [Longilinea arvoryzae]GAP13305.1 transcriptional regulator [Longilinea arvoryzae]